MASSHKPDPQGVTRPLPISSFAFWLQVCACAVVGWTLLHGGLGNGAHPDAAPAGSAPVAGGPGAGVAPSATPAPIGSAAAGGTAPTAGMIARTAASLPGATASASDRPVLLAAAPALDGARLALSTIDVIVARNDTLDHIFRRLKLSLADLASLRGLPGLRERIDSLRPGERLHVTHYDGQLFGLERRLSETETLRVVRDPQGLRADVVQTPLEIRARTVSGRIDHSLFESVEAAGAHDAIAVALADIFGWDIDFVLDVRSGDSFVATYEEIWRDGKYLRDGPIEVCEFMNQGREYRAVRYTAPDGRTAYYSPDGHSLQRAFLRAPLEFTRISSGFNSHRRHPLLNLIRAHKGVDYAAPTGTPVRAAGDGVIRFAGRNGGYGNEVEIQHSRSIVTVYGHLSRFAHGTRVGAHVTQGTVIAYVGMTGLATGPHLHYEYRVNGVFRNPQTVPLPATAAIDPRWREDFLARAAPLLASLDPAPEGPMLVSR